MSKGFSKYYNSLKKEHWYPTEWAVRTLLGSYPNDICDKNHRGKKS